MGDTDNQGHEESVHNEASGHVSGSVGQFGAVYGDVRIGPAETPEDAEWRSRYRARTERQWAEEDAQREAAERLRHAREQEAADRERDRAEEPAKRWRDENAARQQRVGKLRLSTLLLLLVGAAGTVGSVLSDEGTALYTLCLFGQIVLYPGIVVLICYLNATVRYHLWRGW